MYLYILIFLCGTDTRREDYGQEMPIKKSTDQRTGPPILPPQLLQVILNKDVPDHVSDT